MLRLVVRQSRAYPRLALQIGMRRTGSEVERWFSSFVVAGRFLWRMRALRGLTAASTVVTALWLATVLLALQGVAPGRLVALGPDAPGWFSNTLLVATVFVLLFTFPSLGPLSLSLQQRAAEHARAFLQGEEAAPRPFRWWMDRGRYR